jgi:hypothetical protein
VAAEQVAEQVAEHLEDVAEVTRSINMGSVRYFLGGVGLGAAIGFFVGYRFNREKIKAEAFKESEEEIEIIREHYRQKEIARENDTAKEELTQVVIREGYTEEPTPIVDLAALRGRGEEVEQERPLPAPVPITPVQKIYRSTDTEKDKMDGWNFPSELAKRTPEFPYIIHQDEFTHNETEFAQVSYTYYVDDDVLVDESEEILSDREAIIGRNVLTRFGHGTDDYNILYIRNPVLELEIEICRDTGNYQENVLGLEREPNNGGSD